MNFGAAEAIARAVLYEGYILYPYRPSAIKNRRRWIFGGIFPRDFSDHARSDPCTMQTQCLVRGFDPIVEIQVRFLHLVAREVGVPPNPVAELLPDCEPTLTPVPSLEIDGTRYMAWEEAIEREVDAASVELRHRLGGTACIPFGFSGTRQLQPLRRSDGLVAGSFRRTALAVQGELTIAAEQVAGDAFRLTARIENASSCEPCEIDDRNQAQRRALVATHTILGVRGGAFVSLMDPPEDLREAASHCENQGTWPVLVGEAGQTDMLLSSPIILYDYPQIAPESPGDFFDGTEIDEMLTLRILTMTNEEKREMAATDPRTRELLDRTEAMTPAELARLHGALRSPRQFEGAPGGEDNAPWSTVDNKPRLASLQVGGTELTIGDRVRLDPKGRADIMDLVLKDKVAVVEAIECDFEDRVHLAVTIADDPGREMGFGHMPGHRFFFGPDEVQPLAPGSPE
jgi:hydrogenase maturation protease